MRILAFNPGHDGAAALVEDGRLIWSLESEKDSFPRNGGLSVVVVVESLLKLESPPDAIAVGGWDKSLAGFESSFEAGYVGLEPPRLRARSVMGVPCVVGTSSHERSHIFMSLGMSTAASADLAVLVWEGVIGSFYRVHGFGEHIERIPVLHGPGHRYGFLYCLADPRFPGGDVPLDVAGKLMALAAFGDADQASDEAVRVVGAILEPESAFTLKKADFRSSSLWNCGFEDEDFRHAARLLTDRIFDRFLEAATERLPAGLPLLIGGGCGLNCEWNSRWMSCGHFVDVFVPPCTNDSGSAIGTAVDIQNALGGGHRLQWSVDSGAHFVHDAVPAQPWRDRRADPREIAALIAGGAVIPFVQGRAEIGPRALGQRSMLASPLQATMTQRLNALKGREGYRPIAPCCREADFDTFFDGPPDRYMLYFCRVIDDRIPAVTHVDRSARPQVVPPANARLDDLLAAFGRITGVPVLCNTSLNFPGRGFINRMSELLAFAETRELDRFVVDDRLWSRDG
ncbi:carbamoyltransferase C-terminal domain-containing protein [Dactylosporangium sp. NPDC050588]|uniref:carbamoyltransferase C-terminal domain-containing protein n=1 Tax=Dactylosporangium sp. NPDC050588 TaxID=3157211 RepID=UPI0033D1C06C